jgi:hypothetical protein
VCVVCCVLCVVCCVLCVVCCVLCVVCCVLCVVCCVLCEVEVEVEEKIESERKFLKQTNSQNDISLNTQQYR